MDEMEQKLLDYLKRTGETNKRKIARDLKISYSYLMSIFKVLKRIGKIQEVKSYKIK